VFGYRSAPLLGTGGILLQALVAVSRIEIGNGNRFSNNVSLIANERIPIGDDCLVGDLVTILDSDFHEISPSSRTRSSGLTRPVIIGNSV
jgi:acetyltransferase-like isoleucine patch superfamily enzyme